jgi:hypothetical protein
VVVVREQATELAVWVAAVARAMVVPLTLQKLLQMASLTQEVVAVLEGTTAALTVLLDQERTEDLA